MGGKEKLSDSCYIALNDENMYSELRASPSENDVGAVGLLVVRRL